MAVRQDEPVYSERYTEAGRYKDEFRHEVIAYAEEFGVVKASVQFEVKQQTVSRFLRIHRKRQSGLPTHPAESKRVSPQRAVGQLMRSNRFTGLPRHQQKELMAKALLEFTAELLDRLRSPVKENVVTTRGEIKELVQDRPNARDTKDLLLALGIATDKSILLAGEATSRHESVNVTELEHALNEAIKDPQKRRLLAVKVLGGNDVDRSKPAEVIDSSSIAKAHPHTQVRVPGNRQRRKAEREAGL